MEVIREIYDETGCGLVLCGTKLLFKRIEDNRAELEQLLRRGVHKTVLADGPTKGDVEAILKVVGLEMMGEKNANVLATALRLIHFWRNGYLGNKPFGVSLVLENSDIPKLLEQCAAVRSSVGWAVSDGKKLSRMLSPGDAAFFHYIFGLSDGQTRDHFFEALSDGIGLTKEAPVYLLRERLLADRMSSARIDKKERYGLIIKAWNATLAGRKLQQLRYCVIGDNAEEFPEIAGVKSPAANGGAS